MSIITNITTCSIKNNNGVLYTQGNLINDKEIFINKNRKIKKEKIQSRDYSGCKIRLVQRTNQ